MTGTPAHGDARRIVFVTGGSRGIGAACATWFLANGDRVAVTYRAGPEPALPEGAHADAFHRVQVDVRDPDQVEGAFHEIEELWGPVEVLVASAGITRDTLALRMGHAEWSEVIETNLTGSFLVAKRALARMIRLRRGRVVLLSSVGAFVGLPGQANYAASKAGLVGMARALAREVASRGITVNVVAPGIVTTDMTTALGPERIAEMTASVPLQRAGVPQDVAAAVGFLSSEEAAYITGAVLPVDGGLGMGL